ncbi:MAG: nucleotidyltransferase family protein [Anaerolineales bacterium]|nr:nucleotidyltransferase family protein [Anaerolineales bacterium]
MAAKRPPQAEIILNSLKRLKPELQARYFVEDIGLFGSVLRGEQKKSSDIDILVEFSKPIGFFKFLELEEYLGTVLGAKVDLVSKKALKPRIGQQILNEVVAV